MTIYRLPKDLWFPPVDEADDGLLAIGGDLSAERLLLAYRSGIFPWYSRREPILWWSPDQRSVIFPSEFRRARSLAREQRRGTFTVTSDTAFAEVIRACAVVPRKHERGTWITPAMQEAYIHLHELGHAHAIECWRDGALVGGVYGICLGRIFFGESMFSRYPNASKVALATLIDHVVPLGIDLIDTQVANDHVLSLGAREIPRNEYLGHLARLTREPRVPGPWSLRVPGRARNTDILLNKVENQ